MIRVLRLLEYRYASIEAMENDVARWFVQSQNSPNKDVIIKSVTLPLEVFKDE